MPSPEASASRASVGLVSEELEQAIAPDATTTAQTANATARADETFNRLRMLISLLPFFVRVHRGSAGSTSSRYRTLIRPIGRCDV